MSTSAKTREWEVMKAGQGIAIGSTGTQRGMNEEQKLSLREALSSFSRVDSAHHGDCVGADAEFHSLCRELGIPIHVHPPIKTSKRAFCQHAVMTASPKEYLDRNHDIVDACSLLIAAPSGEVEKRRSGTWATVRYARKTGKRVFIMPPDGNVAIEKNGS